jgi:ABC-type uncharacterized transport system involved in gliding motility auxiliary subunit
MDPKELKENFSTQLEKLDREIGQLRQALAQRQELAVKLQGAIEAMNLQLGEAGGQGAEPEAVTEAMAEEPEASAAD